MKVCVSHRFNHPYCQRILDLDSLGQLVDEFDSVINDEKSYVRLTAYPENNRGAFAVIAEVFSNPIFYDEKDKVTKTPVNTMADLLRTIEHARHDAILKRGDNGIEIHDVWIGI